MKKYKVGIVGATGMLGQRFAILLSDHPWFDETVLAASPRSAGQTYEQAAGNRWAMTVPMPEKLKDMVIVDASDVNAVASKVDFVFCSVDMKKDEIRALEEAYARLDSLDTAMDADLHFAFDPRLGYLTQSPSDLGTARHASVYLHLPALQQSRFIYELGGLMVHAHPKQLMASDDPLDYYFADYTGLEITTGGQRIHNYREQIAKLEARGMTVELFESYLMMHKYGMPPHGGMGLGLERIVQNILGLDNIKKATAFPRDRDRIRPYLKGEEL